MVASLSNYQFNPTPDSKPDLFLLEKCHESYLDSTVSA